MGCIHTFTHTLAIVNSAAMNTHVFIVHVSFQLSIHFSFDKHLELLIVC